ncbi:GNAT family N-acetyltransferase [Shouchella clausii]|uniref:GNAT family N-acetyltransferase n=1 Tax=Shouchella clausii TaxID=79880 RepID=A0A268S342_SHOCL|nr:GNAT family protein [Shouchella clausii]PAD44150.1 GNAT family N-acetyltransferase [Bacillus sp. 7520-S]SPU17840.1 aminoglycoside N6'-acetyltransferase [Niallia circulans]MBU8595719.1 GNAT family N-acetyltransferase [Shouchella clausii]MCM3548084.1 GNAT family N-acetyltransferase [Shouchella clausii]MCY1103693.1 GNAT family protein [Shouchella clausii]
MRITGTTVYLRSVQKNDMSSFFNAVQDKEIRYMTGTTKTFTMEQLYEHYERMTNDEHRFDFAICLLNSDEVLGDLSILEIDEANQKAGFRIALHHQQIFNKGYGTEAIQLALRFAFEQLKLNRLQLEVFSHNIRGIKAYEKAGFKIEGVLRQSLYVNNQYSDEIIMAMLRTDYDELKDT